MEPITVVGIGVDGWAGLAEPARNAVAVAEVVVGSTRQLALLPDSGATRVTWPSPMLPAVEPLLAEHAGRRVCVLASGDPMFFGVGGTLVRLFGAGAVRVFPHPSSVSLACARLGWPVEDVDVVSLVGRPVSSLIALPHRRMLVLSAGADTPAEVAALLTDRGFGPTAMTVLDDLGGPAERRQDGQAAAWSATAGALNVIALDCRAAPGVTPLGRTPGLPDDAYDHDGQLTKREVRAVTLAVLAPLPGQLLWDVGAGSGSVAIEWLRTHPSCTAVAVESRPARADRIRANAGLLGVPGLTVVQDRAPDALTGLPRPDAVFVGGGLTGDGVVEACWAALRAGGRLVANAVTLESEAVLTRWQAAVGGTLTRIEVSRAAPVGGFTGWKPMMPVTQWVVTREA
ncbi:precorrin-6y C5,15-methyltransferase (decarboxylating) subunit CbiE [Actinophytocola algeriensis]|uniref:Precorrin-6Y C5,15-methyltransferase (Decarboxylating) n=1 Tax=Actinophytocola algeriensis TaxID=1768010 RepID=A0A7W7QD69_9PSEU|nr:precorrin-6y C5,15-methyltransferase (decarboxylating) subunit CbiE [Actinophytocola algeriensis]MBB4910961.1 precorrin-6Y C5,15-methyltransferase (decarboxylating) [Actinophytocola algeriensis]MBE1473954.1 precorrin-6Y C5,15-methyltransferase (decarboxylating) [Actinophytocola algeriensis]